MTGVTDVSQGSGGGNEKLEADVIFFVFVSPCFRKFQPELFSGVQQEGVWSVPTPSLNNVQMMYKRRVHQE